MRSAALGLSLLLAACSGGGGDSGGSTPPIAPSVTSAEGLWQGSTSTGASLTMLILETGETAALLTANGTLAGALHGNTSSSGTILFGSGVEFDLASRTTRQTTYSGSFAARSNLTMTLATTGVTWTGSYNTAYELPASLATAAGTFAGAGTTGSSGVQPITVLVSASGTITMPATQGCSADGTAQPRASGKNVVDVTVTFHGSTCALGDGTVTTGLAYYDTNTRRVLVLAMNAARSDVFVGQKL